MVQRSVHTNVNPSESNAMESTVTLKTNVLKEKEMIWSNNEGIAMKCGLVGHLI